MFQMVWLYVCENRKPLSFKIVVTMSFEKLFLDFERHTMMRVMITASLLLKITDRLYFGGLSYKQSLCFAAHVN